MVCRNVEIFYELVLSYFYLSEECVYFCYFWLHLLQQNLFWYEACTTFIEVPFWVLALSFTKVIFEYNIF